VNKRVLLPVVLILVFALSRWPGLMAPNFSATYALLFCAGLYLPGWMGWVIPLSVLAASDFLISAFFYPQANISFGRSIIGLLPNYLAYAGLIGLGRLFGAKRSWWMLLGGGIIGALLFYIVTNTQAWLSLSYAKTLAGWIQAITVGLPGYPQTWEFFRNTCLSGGLFTGLFVGAVKWTEPAEKTAEKEAPDTKPEAEPAPSQP
jgi:hypothetical protein